MEIPILRKTDFLLGQLSGDVTVKYIPFPSHSHDNSVELVSRTDSYYSTGRGGGIRDARYYSCQQHALDHTSRIPRPHRGCHRPCPTETRTCPLYLYCGRYRRYSFEKVTKNKGRFNTKAIFSSVMIFSINTKRSIHRSHHWCQWHTPTEKYPI